jgi:hypothetical protein
MVNRMHPFAFITRREHGSKHRLGSVAHHNPLIRHNIKRILYPPIPYRSALERCGRHAMGSQVYPYLQSFPTLCDDLVSL